MKLAIQPMRARPSPTKNTPVKMASQTVRIRYRSPSLPANGATTDAEMIATVELGPTNRCLDDPKTAYPMSANGAVTSPISGDTPAMPA
jgi:hypothetical protein